MNFARNDRDPDIRKRAVESIAQLDPPSRALDVLAQIVRNDPDESVRREAAETIAEVHDPSRYRSPAPSIEVRKKALETIADFKDEQSALRLLKTVVENDNEPDIRRYAVEALAELNDDVGVPFLRELAKSSRFPEVRAKAREMLDDK
ncbi:MAG: HEAT repeat domain-containing protein [Gemmatimonadales bacterium]